MLKITIPDMEFYDEKNECFVTVKGQTLHLEHSLVSLSKWESKWEKPFLSKEGMSIEQTIDYIRCMTLTQNVDPSIYNYIPPEEIERVNKYIAAPMTATWFSDEQNKPIGGRREETVTAELIYYWMIALNIPFECQKWHLNRLLTLVKVCNIKNTPPKKMSKRDIMNRNRSLNEARRRSMSSRG